MFRESFGIDRQFSESERRRALQAYLGLCSFMDANVGRVLAAVDSSGFADDTLVIYTSDHGESAGAHGLWFKHLMNEESVRVPLLMAGPGVTHDVIDTPVSHIDLVPTLLAAAQCELANSERLPGISLLDTVALDATDRGVLAEYHANGSVAGSFMLRYRRFKYIEYIGERPQLFDLDADPDEMVDLSRHPGLARRRQRLRDPASADL